MAENTIFISNYIQCDIAPVSPSEVWRYASFVGGPSKDSTILSLYNEVDAHLQDKLQYKVCYRRMPLLKENDNVILPFNTSSLDIKRLLSDCSEIVIFAATLGMEIDRFISRNSIVSPTKALIAQAYGAERIEALCDKFCNDILRGSCNAKISRRFSPGYGDFPLSHQEDFFRLLDCNRKIGLSLNSSGLMSPSKSVTALFGITHADHSTDILDIEHKCNLCSKTNCEYRKS